MGEYDLFSSFAKVELIIALVSGLSQFLRYHLPVYDVPPVCNVLVPLVLIFKVVSMFHTSRPRIGVPLNSLDP